MKTNIYPLGVGSCSLAYTDGTNVVKEVYGSNPLEVEARINNFKNNYLLPKSNVDVIFPKVINYNNRTFLVTPFVKGHRVENKDSEYFKKLVNYAKAKQKGLNYIDRGSGNFIQTESGKIINFDPVADLGENVKNTIMNRIKTSPNNKLSHAQRELKKKLLADPSNYKDLHLWRLIQNDMAKRTKMTNTMFNEIINE